LGKQNKYKFINMTLTLAYYLQSNQMLYLKKEFD